MASSPPKKKLSPEEEVRQRLFNHIVQERGFPKSSIVLEKELSLLPHLGQSRDLPSRRIDLLAYQAGAMRPLLLVECKAVKLSKKAIAQVMGYNHYIQAPFICLVNQEELITGWFDPQIKGMRFIDGVPHYQELIENLPLLKL